jgi:hypothetical protein
MTKDQIYYAFKLSENEPYYLKIRPVWRSWERMSYSQLWRILENGYGTQIGLVYSFAVVLIKGQNLDPIANAIDQHLCELVQEYDKELWQKPVDSKTPFIDSIDIYTETREKMVSATDQFLTDTATARSKRGH